MSYQKPNNWTRNCQDCSADRRCVVLLALVSGLGVDSAKPMIAEVGAQAATFPSAKQLASWVGGMPRR